MLPLRSERIRVLHLGNPGGLYGAERWILALVKHLSADHIESSVAVLKDAPDQSAPLCEHAARLGLQTHLFEARGRLSLSAIRQLRDFILDHHIDILHTHGYKTDILGRLATRGTHARVVATPHGWGASPGVKLQAYEALDRLFLVSIDAVVPLSQQIFEGLRRIPGLRRKLHLIPNGVDLSEIDAAGAPPAPLPSWHDDGCVVIGYVGRLDRGKRIDTLIRAFDGLPAVRKRLCIVGDGLERPALERMTRDLGLQDRIAFLGFRGDRLALMRGFDLFVLPSQHEGIPRCLMEAMAVGVSVVASNIPGCRNLVQNESTGLLFEVADDEGLAAQLTRLVGNPSLRAALARAGQRRVRTQFSAQAMASGYLSLYEQLVSSRAVVRTVKESF